MLCAHSRAFGLEIGFRYIVSESDSISTELVVADSLSSKLLEQIDKGVPVGFEYRMELWKVRSGWFDRQIAAYSLSYKIRYDTWAKDYTVVEVRPNITVENSLTRQREVIDLVTASDRVTVPVDDTSGAFYLVGRVSIKIMTLSNFREVESWLKGEISEVEKPKIKDAPNKFTEFLFNTALKVTGLENVAREFKTGVFRMEELPLRFEVKPE